MWFLSFFHTENMDYGFQINIGDYFFSKANLINLK